jgi:hypothetical protein
MLVDRFGVSMADRPIGHPPYDGGTGEWDVVDQGSGGDAPPERNSNSGDGLLNPRKVELR